MKWILYPLIILLLVVAVAAGALSISAGNFRKSDLIADHVTISKVEVGQLPEAEAIRKLEDEWLPSLPETLTVIVGDEQHELSAEKLGRQPQVEQAVTKALRVGREGNLFTQLVTRLRMMKAPIDLPVEIRVDEPRLSDELLKLAAKVDRQPVDATVSVSGDDDVSVTPGKPGLKLDRKTSTLAITQALTQLETTPVKLTCKETQPRVSAQDLAHLEVVLGSYSTSYSAAKVDRTHNLAIAIQAINKTVVMPGEEFSTDQSIGPRIAERGFREAPIFQDGEVTPATGGGICQIATTIYNTALFAGLKMIERHHHSQPVTYAPAGRDATVYAGLFDMRFRNDTSFPILMLGSLSGSRVHVRILGKREANKQVRIERSGVSTMPFAVKEIPDPQLDLGKREVEKKGRNGIKVTVYRIVEQADGTEKRESLHTDVYRAQTEVVHVGTKPVFYKGPDGKPVLGPDGKPVPVKLDPKGKPLPYKPPPNAKPADGKPATAGAQPGAVAKPVAADAKKPAAAGAKKPAPKPARPSKPAKPSTGD